MRFIIMKLPMFAAFCVWAIAAMQPVLFSGETSCLPSQKIDYIECASGVIPYTVSGSGNKTVLFVHGFMDAGNVWESVIQRINSREYQCITLDLPFMGQLSGTPGEVSLSMLAEAVIEVVDELTGPVTLVGQSMGAQIVELVARSRPGRVERMVFIAPVPLAGLPVPEQFSIAMRAMANNESMQYEFRQQAFPDLPKEELKKLVDNGMRVTPHNVVALIERWSKGHPAGWAPGPDDIPVLIIGGATDPICTPDVLRAQIAPRFAAGKTIFLPHAGHWPHIEHPEEIAKEIAQFIEEVEQK